MTRFRRRLVLSGLAGLTADAALAALAAWLIAAGLVQAPLPYPLVTLIAAVAFGGLSLAEIPIMILAIRHLIAERSRSGNCTLALGLNAVFVFFAAVYGLPVLLVTGSLVWGLALCALGLVRLAASLLFIREPHPSNGI